MQCRKVALPGGGAAIICGPKPRRRNCKFCSRYADLECDFPFTGKKAGKTCDVPMCLRCSTKQNDGKDFCPPHERYRAKVEQQMMLALEAGLEIEPPDPDGC
jgi:hypothetical protein